MSSSAVLEKTIDRVMQWLLVGETGLSSTCMVANIFSHESIKKIKAYETTVHPLDSGDFYRCYKLLEAIPEFREHLPIMRKVSPYWEVLVDHWDELESLLKEDLRDKARGSRKLYDRMKELYKPLDDVRYTAKI
jgi:hypothetical protein